MKIKSADLTLLIAILKDGITRVPSAEAYARRDPSIRRIDLAQDTSKRHRWDAFWASSHPEKRDWMLGVYEYANDSHIDTALRAALKELQQVEVLTLVPFYEVGDRIRAMDFEDRPGRGSCFVEGTITEVSVYHNSYVITCDREVWDGKDFVRGRIGKTIFVPFKLFGGDWERRVSRLYGVREMAADAAVAS